jgi:hypothetical protein
MGSLPGIPRAGIATPRGIAPIRERFPLRHATPACPVAIPAGPEAWPVAVGIALGRPPGRGCSRRWGGETPRCRPARLNHKGLGHGSEPAPSGHLRGCEWLAKAGSPACDAAEPAPSGHLRGCEWLAKAGSPACDAAEPAPSGHLRGREWLAKAGSLASDPARPVARPGQMKGGHDAPHPRLVSARKRPWRVRAFHSDTWTLRSSAVSVSRRASRCSFW